MSILQNLNTDNDIHESGDSLPNGIRESGIYLDTIRKAYLTESQGGAHAVALELQDSNGSTLKATVYFTSGKAKGQKNFYERNGEKHYLPGFELMDNMCKLVTGKGLSQQDTQPRMVDVYNYDAGSNIPTEVQALHELWGKQVITGVQKQQVNKNIKNDQGVYVPTAEVREQNEIVKFFDAASEQTLIEKASNSPAKYINDWKAKFEGKVVNKLSKDAPSAGTPFAAPGKAAGGAPKTTQAVDSLFND